MILRCTAKVLALLRAPKPPNLPTIEPAASDWYANQVWIERRKCLLLTHAGTLFSVFVPDVAAADLRPPGPLVVASIYTALRAENLPAATFGELDPDVITVARTADRRILGSMNEHVHEIGWRIAATGGLARVDLDRLHHELHRTLNTLTGYRPPIDLARTGATPP